MPDVVVQLENVFKDFEDTRVLDDVSLTIHRGEFITLLGPSGCGKTTTLRLIAGFEEPTHGIVKINDQDVTGLPPYKRRVNTVFQHYALFPHMTVAQNVAFGLSVQGLPAATIDKRIKEALALVKLSAMGDKYPLQISGGQRQRVALARALVLEPQVLLLDEPMGALDVKLRKEMQVELKNLQKRLSITFLLVTHDQEEALVMSDRIAVMNAGRIEQLATSQEIYERPRSVFVADFLGFTNLLPGTIEERTGAVARVKVDGGPVIAAAGPDDLTAGPVTVGVRPEKVRLLAADQPASDGVAKDAAATGARGTPATATGSGGAGVNVLAGQIEDVIYLGAGVRYVVRVSPGVAMTVALPATDVPLLAVGSAVRLSFAPQEAVTLKAKETRQ